MIQVGTKAPDFSVQDHDGNTVSLSDFAGNKVVIFFYPKANTPGCTLEACDLRDHYSELTEAGYSILGVSADTVSAQAKYFRRHRTELYTVSGGHIKKKTGEGLGLLGPGPPLQAPGHGVNPAVP